MDEDPKKTVLRKKRLIRIAGSLLSLAVLTYIAIALISGSQSGHFRFFGLFSDSENAQMASEFFFDVGRNRVFADLGGSLAAAGTLGLQVLDAGGYETLRDSFRMATPMVCSQGDRAVSYDIGGTSVRVFNNSEVLVSIETDGLIIAASINKNGWFAVCTQEGGASKGTVTVYNDAGNPTYRVNLASGYLLTAVLTSDNKSLAVLNLTPGGSRISFYELNSEDVDHIFELPGKLILDMSYTTGGTMLLVTENSLIGLGKKNEDTEIYDFAGRRLGGYAIYVDSIVLYLLDYNVGYSGGIISIDEKGSVLGEIETDREIIDLTYGDGQIALLRGDGIAFFETSLEELPLADDSVSSVGATKIISFGKGRVLAAGDHSAVVFRVES